MGWDGQYSWRSPRDVRDTLNRDRQASGRTKLVDQKSTQYGKHLWSLFETQVDQDTPGLGLVPKGTRFITLDLIEKHGDCWMHKGIDEMSHPFHYDCPVSLLNKATAPLNEGARKFREGVLAQRAAMARTFEVGTRLSLYGKAYTVTRKLPVNRGLIVTRDDGQVFRMPRKHVAEATVIEPTTAQEVA